MNSDNDRRNGTGGNKLRTYRTFKSDIYTETYLYKLMIPSHRRAYAQFRCGVAPIRIETGRYEGLPVNQRTCFVCNDIIETEEHVLTECPLYADLRDELYRILILECEHFSHMSNSEKLAFILSNSNENLIPKCAKTC